MEKELKYFVEIAYKLKQSSFLNWCLNESSESDYIKIIGGDWLAHGNLHQEDLDSFCLSLRLLIQDRDGFSIRKIKEKAELWSEEFEEQQIGILEAIKKLNENLSSPCLVMLPNNQNTTNDELFDIIFYGGIVHRDKKKRDVFDKMVTAGFFSFFVFRSFTTILLKYNNCIQTIAYYIVQYQKKNEL